VVVELGVLDRLRNLPGDGHQQVDLVAAELPRLLGADVEGAFETVSGEDRDGEDRLVVRLAQVGKVLEAGIQVGLTRDHHGGALGRGCARDALPGPHLRNARHVLDPGAVRRPEDELVGRLVVQVDEAGVGLEGLRDLVRDQVEDLLQVQSRVHRGDRLRQETQVAGRSVHVNDIQARVSRHR
jgi:hypothetical protein